MEPGQYQTQIALSLIVILGAVLVALLCDLLKGNNEQLRELSLKLKVRYEDMNKRFQTLAPHASAGPYTATRNATAAAIERLEMGRSGKARTCPARASTSLETREPSGEHALSQERSFMRANSLARQIEEPVAAVRPPADFVTKRLEMREKRAIAPEALAAIQRGKQLASSSRPRRAPDRIPTRRPPVIIPVQQSEPGIGVPMVEVMEAAAKPAPALAPTAAKKPAGPSRDWSSVLNTGRQSGAAKQTRLQFPAIAAAFPATESSRTEPALPVAFQVGSRQLISGLVISSGVSTAQDTNRSIPASIRALIQSLDRTP